MPVDQTMTVHITCDNPACPGNELDPADRTGWLFISAEIYGQPTTQTVFCCDECVSAVTAEPPSPLTEQAPTPAP